MVSAPKKNIRDKELCRAAKILRSMTMTTIRDFADICRDFSSLHPNGKRRFRSDKNLPCSGEKPDIPDR